MQPRQIGALSDFQYQLASSAARLASAAASISAKIGSGSTVLTLASAGTLAIGAAASAARTKFWPEKASAWRFPWRVPMWVKSPAFGAGDEVQAAAFGGRMSATIWMACAGVAPPPQTP
jgi:hypothetical protein